MQNEYLDIVHVGVSESGKTEVWQAINKRTGEMAGEVRYRYGCHGYAFYPSNDFFFDAKCLQQITDFLRAANNSKRHEQAR